MGKKAKSRTQVAYNRKLDHLKRWHEERTEARKTWSEKRLAETKALKPLEWYTNQIRKSGGK